MTRRRGSARPQIDPLSDAAWSRIERALWRRWAAIDEARRFELVGADSPAPGSTTATSSGLLRRPHRRCAGGSKLLG